MDAAHILLGKPWLYDLDIRSYKKLNTHTFMHNDKKDSDDTFPTQNLNWW